MTKHLWDWQTFAVPQRNMGTGCIPTGYEMLLRAAKAENIDFDGFQEEFDQARNGGINCFGTVADAIESRYPFVKFKLMEFEKGVEKLAFIEQNAPKTLLLVSLANPGGGWHIMPVLDVRSKNITLLRFMLHDGTAQLRKIPKTELIDLHDNRPGGKDIAYLLSCCTYQHNKGVNATT